MKLVINLPEETYKKIVDRIVTVSDVDIICRAILDHEGEEKERPHGEWIDKDCFGEEVYCSECGHMEKKEKFIWSDVNYCYFCGARMKEGEAE